jgi:hypothetical protein
MELFWGKAAFCGQKEAMCFKSVDLMGGAAGALRRVLPVFLSASLNLGVVNLK